MIVFWVVFSVSAYISFQKAVDEPIFLVASLFGKILPLTIKLPFVSTDITELVASLSLEVPTNISPVAMVDGVPARLNALGLAAPAIMPRLEVDTQASPPVALLEAIKTLPLAHSSAPIISVELAIELLAIVELETKLRAASTPRLKLVVAVVLSELVIVKTPVSILKLVLAKFVPELVYCVQAN